MPSPAHWTIRKDAKCAAVKIILEFVKCIKALDCIKRFFVCLYCNMDLEKIENRLQDLKSDSPPKFGIMSAQHMVEHLILTIKLSYGRVKIPDFSPNEKQLNAKQALLYTDMEFPEGVRAPGLPAELLELRYPDLDTAKEELKKAIVAYQETYAKSPEAKFLHTRFGLLSHKEWEIFHHKHIGHHFRQFGI